MFLLQPEAAEDHLAQAAPFFNGLFLALVVGLMELGSALALYVWARFRAEERDALMGALPVVLSAAALCSVTWEMAVGGYAGPLILAAWTADTLLVQAVALRWWHMPLRVVGLLQQTVVAVWLAGLYLSSPPGLHAFRNDEFPTACGVLLGMGLSLLLYTRSRRAPPEVEEVSEALPVALSLLGLLVLSEEMLRAHCASQWLMLAWAGAALLLLNLGVRVPHGPLRVVGLLLQGVVVAWLLALYPQRPEDLPGQYVPFGNSLFGCFVAAAVTLGLVLRLYARRGPGCPEAPYLRAVGALLLGALGLWGLTAELVRSFAFLQAQHVVPPGSGNFAVSALWCLYATALIILGMWRRDAQVRLLGLLVFTVAVVKVLIYDVAALEQLWRILSLACLAALLLGVSYLYHLYGERILAFAIQDEPEAGAPGD
jgi:uncharacterized membrane protein